MIDIENMRFYVIHVIKHFVSMIIETCLTEQDHVSRCNICHYITVIFLAYFMYNF